MKTDSVEGLRAAQRRLAEMFAPPLRSPLPANVAALEAEEARAEEVRTRNERQKQWQLEQAELRQQAKEDLRGWRACRNEIANRQQSAAAERSAALAAHDVDAAIRADLEIGACARLAEECDREMERRFGPRWGWPAT